LTPSWMTAPAGAGMMRAMTTATWPRPTEPVSLDTWRDPDPAHAGRISCLSLRRSGRWR